MPDYGVSTPEAFAAYDRVGSSRHPDCEAQEAAIRAEDLAAVCAATKNKVGAAGAFCAPTGVPGEREAVTMLFTERSEL